MTRNSLGTARYGVVQHDGEITVVYAVALIQALTMFCLRPRRVFLFENDRVCVIDDNVLEICWLKSLKNY